MPAPISSASPNGLPARRRAPWRASRAPAPGRSRRSRSPTWRRTRRPRVVVAGVRVLDLLRRSPSGRRASARDSRCSSPHQSLRSAPWKRRHRAAEPARRGAAAGADRRADAPRRAGGELLVPPPPGRLRVDRRAGRAAARSPTSPAARATAPTCSPQRAAEVVGVDANPEAHEHARLRYRRPNLRFERDLVERFRRAMRRDRLPADDRARRGARRPARPLRRDGAGRLRLDPEPAHAGAARAPRSPTTRGTCASTRPAEYRELLEPRFCADRALGVFHARKLRAARARACGRAGTAFTRLCGSPKPFYDRFVPAISASDFELRCASPSATSTERSTSSRSATREPGGAIRHRPRRPRTRSGGGGGHW